MIPTVPDLSTLPYATAEMCEPCPAGTPLEWALRWQYVQPQHADATTNEYGISAAHSAKLKALESDRSLLPFGAPPPSDIALLFARVVLDYLKELDLSPDRVIASAEGGVALCFEEGERYADIECLNTGEILGVLSNRRDRPDVWEIEQSARSIASAASRIEGFFSRSAT